MFGRKVAAAMEFAATVGCPYIAINDSGGARVQDAATSLAWYAEMSRRQEALSGTVPQISIMLGKCAGGAVYAPINTDVLVATKDAFMFVTGPDVIREVTGEDVSMAELGSAHSQAEYGTIHHVADSEAEVFAWVRRYLSFMPSSCTERPPLVEPGLEPGLTESDLELNEIVPDCDNAAYDMYDVLARLFDDDEFFEIGGQAARNIITGYARIDGHAVAVIASQPRVLSGAIDARCSDKASHFIQVNDAFSIPLVFVVDTPGVLPGVEEEKIGVIKRGGRFFYCVATASVPILTVVVRKAYGGAYAVMGCKQLGADINLAWPTARIAVMGAQSAVSIVGCKQIAAAGENADAVRRQLIDFYNETVATPWTAAERGYIDAVIEPATTRLELRRALRLLLDKGIAPEQRPRKHRLLPL
jgi:acetyl-CoA carboxylase carboxyltransferase component